jgi:hypothetical protein
MDKFSGWMHYYKKIKITFIIFFNYNKYICLINRKKTMGGCFLNYGNNPERVGINQREINIEQPLFVAFYSMAGGKVYETYDATNGKKDYLPLISGKF